jgi:hypothetical protein
VTPSSLAARSVGAGAQESLDHRAVVLVGSPMKRRRAIALPGVDVDALLEE